MSEAPDPLEIAFFNLTQKFALTSCGHSIPITNMFDGHGDECDDPEEVVTVVAGPYMDKWLVYDLRTCERVMVH